MFNFSRSVHVFFCAVALISEPHLMEYISREHTSNESNQEKCEFCCAPLKSLNRIWLKPKVGFRRHMRHLIWSHPVKRCEPVDGLTCSLLVIISDPWWEYSCSQLEFGSIGIVIPGSPSVTYEFLFHHIKKLRNVCTLCVCPTNDGLTRSSRSRPWLQWFFTWSDYWRPVPADRWKHSESLLIRAIISIW
jgi:hypothetical protein